MTYGSEGYLRHHRDNERVANMVRSITQDGCRNFQKKTIDTIFVEKIVDGVDIGKICSDLIMIIAGSLNADKTEEYDSDKTYVIVELIEIIYVDYDEGINPYKDIVWHMKWLTCGVPLLAKKINTLPSTGKVAPMASLEKPDKTMRDIKDVKW